MTCFIPVTDLEKRRSPASEASHALLSMDRRSKPRYPLELQVSYQTLGTRKISGEGLAANLSSGGILIVSDQQPSAGARLEVRIQWPFYLEERIPLQLVAVGEVMRCEPTGFAVAFRRYQFRTLKSKTDLMSR